MAEDDRYTPEVLRNRGVAVQLAVVERHSDRVGPPPADPLAKDDRPVKVRWEPVVDDNGQAVEETVYVRFTMNTVADLEAEYGTQPRWQQAFQFRPTAAIRTVLKLACGYELEEAGAKMIGGQVDVYRSAVGAAWGLAHGMDPSPLARGMKQAALAQAAKIDAVEYAMTTDLEGSSPGPGGLEDGPELAEASTSSGL